MCNYCKGEKTRKGDEVIKLDCGHSICENCLNLYRPKGRPTLYVPDLLRCPVCEERD